ncbi:MAG TPA: S41 family peptidase [Euzebya sp.]|nr:S41 family peptidase [Euzebya sp.]
MADQDPLTPAYDPAPSADDVPGTRSAEHFMSTPTPPLPPPPRLAFLTRPGEFTTTLAIGVVLLLIGGTGILGFRLGTQDGPALSQEFANIELLYEAIGSDAVEAPGDEELVNGAIDGLLGTLEDPYAVYYDPDRYDALNADLDGEFVGIGITIEEQSDGVYVTGVLPSSPAQAAGVQAGERITSVDGEPTEGLTSGEVVELIAGDEGEDVTVGFDLGDAGPRELTMTREQLQLPQVIAETLDSGFGYIAVTQFSRRVDTEMTTQLNQMLQEGVPGLILDLRGNPGGLLNEAVEVVSLFVEEGPVVRVDSRTGSQERNALGSPLAPHLPLVVLVDGNSASASEIVAGALQDLDRATIVGEQTFGKGTVQTIQDLTLGAGVKFTTARYFTPSGDSIEGVGIAPDVAAEGTPEEELAVAEEVLAGLLAGTARPGGS